MSSEASVGPLKRTPLYEIHQQLGGKIVPFAGWELPVQYSGLINEHHAVRQKAGLFDVSHMGEVFVTGPEAEQALQYLTCNDVAKLTDGKAQYSAIINPKGGVVDDIIIYRYSREKYLVCVNASNADKDFAWFTKHNKHNKHKATFVNRSSEFGQIAIQGPLAIKIACALAPKAGLDAVPYFGFKEIEILGCTIIAAHTGYTGEDGFEFFVPTAKTADLWQALLETGAKDGLIPCGLGARDTLRLEACYPLHGHELGDEISAIESGLGWIVKPKKGDFIGRDVLVKHIEQGAPRSLVGFYVTDPGIVRENEKMFSADGKEIGRSTSGTKTPTVNRALGMALVQTAFSKPGTKILAEVRGRKIACEVTKMPFYKRGA